ncbi:MAG: hypothetical protein R3B91_11895 [Planctomycetaceae bacterium]
MSELSSASGLLQFLQQVPDPRGRSERQGSASPGQRHSHVAMLAVMICATLWFPGYAGAAQWIKLLPIAFWHQLGGRRKPPCENAFRNLMMVVCPLALEEALVAVVDRRAWEDHHRRRRVASDRAGWQSCSKAHGASSANDDGRGSARSRRPAALSQTPVDGQTNEAKTALAMLQGMSGRNRDLGDAAYCQQDMCETITQNNGDYLLIVKANQPKLHRAAQQSFVIPKGLFPTENVEARERMRSAFTLEKNRGRVERRTLSGHQHSGCGVGRLDRPGTVSQARTVCHCSW